MKACSLCPIPCLKLLFKGFLQNVLKSSQKLGTRHAKIIVCKMGESVHDGPGASITNAALCAAMQRVLSKSRCNFMMACFMLSMLHACKQQTGRYPAKCRCCRLAFFFWHKGTRETPVVKRITRITRARKQETQ